MSRLLVILLSAVTLTVCPSTSRGEKVALLIGVSKYKHSSMSSLKYPEADANAVRDVLQKAGYKVVLLVGKAATRSEISAQLERLSKSGSADGAVFVGLFGHGVQYGKAAYFAPYDARLRVVRDAKGRIVRRESGSPLLEPDPDTITSLRSILDALALSGAGHKVIFADCCREDPSAARGRAFGAGVGVTQLPARTAALFACSERERAYEHDDWQHGAFTQAFLEVAPKIASVGPVTAGTLAERMHSLVRRMVREKADAEQTVTYMNSGVVDLLLSNIAPTDTPATASPSRMSTRSIEGVWEQHFKDGRNIWINGGRFRVVKDIRSGRLKMEILSQQSDREAVRSSGLFDVAFDGTSWTFKSNWGSNGIAEFRLQRTTDDLYEGWAWLNNRKINANRWTRIK